MKLRNKSGKISKLTPAQESILPRFRDEWMAWGTCTDRADRPRAEAAIMALRRRIGVTNQPTFIWCQSPATSALAAHFLKSDEFRLWRSGLWNSMGDSLWEDLKFTLRDCLGLGLGRRIVADLLDRLQASLWISVRASLEMGIRDSLWISIQANLGRGLTDNLVDSVRSGLGGSFGLGAPECLTASLKDSLQESLWRGPGRSLINSIRDSLGVSLQNSLGRGLGDSLWESLTSSRWGQQDAYWIAFYLFCRDVLNIQYEPEHSADLDLWRDLAQSCCWWQCYENYVIISERPTVCVLDTQEVLHRPDGPALAFADGWALHRWHGVRIPAAWIEDKKSLTPAMALMEQNVERRRAACEILGWDRILKELDAITIHRDPDPTIGELLEVNLPGSGKERFLRVRCGTGRTFAVPVPPNVKTALQANAWSYGVDANNYKPEIRT